MNIKYTLYFLLLIVLCPAHGNAQLCWERKTVELKLSIDDDKGIGTFPFKNSGSHPVTIAKVETSCMCTQAQTDKPVYQPGESGILTATYGVGAGAQGIRTEKISVTTDDKAEPTALFEMKVSLPEVLKLEPSAVSWQVGEEPAPKTITVEVVTDRELNVNEVLWMPKRVNHSWRVVTRIHTKLETLVPHKKYRVTITPESTAAPTADETIVVLTDYPKSQVKRAFATASIKTSEPK